MKLEVGKNYRTRGGWRAKIVADDLGDEDCYGAIHYMADGCNMERHSQDGLFVQGEQWLYDLITEWVEPAKPLECWVAYTADLDVRAVFDSLDDAENYRSGLVNAGYTIKHMREVVGE